ncbi:MAG: nitrile hydratase accessory protein [Candidatus Rokubacteria bacterium]|nr:nitrile hydratase accessory protein [Candidatus Rokubacteria bacterium]
MGTPDLSALPAIPRDAEGPVGRFTWREWTDALAAEIAAARARGDATTPYYEHWLAALEKLVATKRLVSSTELLQRKDAWDRAARATPHGQPIVLQRGQ